MVDARSDCGVLGVELRVRRYVDVGDVELQGGRGISVTYDALLAPVFAPFRRWALLLVR